MKNSPRHELMLEEMNLIESARRNTAQAVTVAHDERLTE